MRQTPEVVLKHKGRVRRRLLVAALALAAPVAALGAATPALATSAFREEFAPFTNCPVETQVVQDSTHIRACAAQRAVAIWQFEEAA